MFLIEERKTSYGGKSRAKRGYSSVRAKPSCLSRFRVVLLWTILNRVPGCNPWSLSIRTWLDLRTTDCTLSTLWCEFPKSGDGFPGLLRGVNMVGRTFFSFKHFFWGGGMNIV